MVAAGGHAFQAVQKSTSDELGGLLQLGPCCTGYLTMRLLWPLAFLLSLISTGTGVRASADVASDGQLFDQLFAASSIAAVAIMVFLLIDYYRATGAKYRGSDLTRARIAVIAVGDIAVILLAIRIWSAGSGLLD